jgi:recombinational DNA repair protein (RecF pathway)
MAIKTMTTGTGYHECSRCHERIAVGAYYVRSGSQYTHADPCAAPAAAAPVVVAVSVREPRAARTFGALTVDGSFQEWEREYDAEG